LKEGAVSVLALEEVFFQSAQRTVGFLAEIAGGLRALLVNAKLSTAAPPGTVPSMRKVKSLARERQ
jgi:hypothetical protein